MGNKTAKPSNYCSSPMGSISQNCETEIIACNIMRILKKTGDTFRDLSFEEYESARFDDGAELCHIDNEKPYFEMVIVHCTSPLAANKFCRGWYSEAVLD